MMCQYGRSHFFLPTESCAAEVIAGLCRVQATCRRNGFSRITVVCQLSRDSLGGSDTPEAGSVGDSPSCDRHDCQHLVTELSNDPDRDTSSARSHERCRHQRLHVSPLLRVNRTRELIKKLLDLLVSGLVRKVDVSGENGLAVIPCDASTRRLCRESDPRRRARRIGPTSARYGRGNAVCCS